jgi:hypothetical protein
MNGIPGNEWWRKETPGIKERVEEHAWRGSGKVESVGFGRVAIVWSDVLESREVLSQEELTRWREEGEEDKVDGIMWGRETRVEYWIQIGIRGPWW